jgi:hypothetical protein
MPVATRTEQLESMIGLLDDDMWLVTTSQEHVRVFTGHFDNLIRAAIMQPPEVIEYLKRLLGEVTAGDRSNRTAPVQA